MFKNYIKITVIAVLVLTIVFEICHIIKINIKPQETTAEVTQATVVPEENNIPVVSGSTPRPQDKTETGQKIIVIDPGHGKPSSLMSDDEKSASGWVQNSSGAWGEWRHYRKGSSTVNCEGSGCNGRVTPDGACWYPIGNSDRNTEPDLNLQNALAAKKHLEAMGYTVRLTRTSNDENPSITKRLSYCHPDNDTSKAPDAEVFVCIHANASGGSGRGTAYITAEDPYDQAWIEAGYASLSNELGKLCNDYIVDMTSLSLHGNGTIAWEPELVVFCKSPVPCGYLEVGFFDNSADLNILRTETDKIGEAIAKGVDEFCKIH